MPRQNTKRGQNLLHTGQLLYFALRRKDRAELRKQETRARKRSLALDHRMHQALERDECKAAHLNKRIDKIEKHPSKLAIKTLQEIAKSRKTPGAQRARAAAILLRWSNGDFSHGKRRGRKSGGD